MQDAQSPAIHGDTIIDPVPTRARGLLAVGNNTAPTLLVMLLHVPLVFLIKYSIFTATAYAWGVFLLGLFAVYLNNYVALAICAGYIAGAEILWRMVPTATLWEQGKYSLVFLLALYNLSTPARKSTRPYLHYYFLLLLPSVFLSLIEGGDKFRNLISFNMSGPLSLYICGLFFSRNTFTRQEYRSLIAWTCAPIISLAFLCFWGIISLEEIVFRFESNFQTSGGYGPNQVATVLGIGIVFMFLLVILPQNNKRLLRIVNLSVMLWFLSQAMLTFSRGGLLVSIAALFFCCAYIMQTRTTGKIALILLVAILSVISIYYIFPEINSFTGAKLEGRYAEDSTVGRTTMMLEDLRIFTEHPLLGVGPGRVKKFRIIYKNLPSHTEITRLLSEHGLFGLFALIFLCLWLWGNFRQQATPVMRATVLVLIMLGIGTMLHSAMRLAVISFCLGLTAAQIVPDRLPLPAVDTNDA